MYALHLNCAFKVQPQPQKATIHGMSVFALLLKLVSACKATPQAWGASCQRGCVVSDKIWCPDACIPGALIRQQLSWHALAQLAHSCARIQALKTLV